MPNQSPWWLRWASGMGERRKLGDVAMDVLLFAGMVSSRCGAIRCDAMRFSHATKRRDFWSVPAC